MRGWHGGGVGRRSGCGGEKGRSAEAAGVARAGAAARMRCARSGGRSVSDCAIGGCGSGGDPPVGCLPVAAPGMGSGSDAGCGSGGERPGLGWGCGRQGCTRWLWEEEARLWQEEELWLVGSHGRRPGAVRSC